MKKIMLTVAEPCHENWNEMTPQDQSRFCATCSKTVIDFTAMSDQQIVAFFKRKSGAVCGRFYKDQLHRPITQQEKRFTLPKHFFRYTWPAFLLFLKACNEKMDEGYATMGVLVELPNSATEPVVGDTVFQMLPSETSLALAEPAITEHCRRPNTFAPPVIKGEAEVSIPANTDEQDFNQKDAAFTAVDTTQVDVNDLSIVSIPDTAGMMMGMVFVSLQEKDTIQRETKKEVPEQKDIPVLPTVGVYPNPVTIGQNLIARFKAPFRGSYQVYSMSGQLMLAGLLTNNKTLQHMISTDRLVSGSYLIRFADEANQAYTAKFLIR